METKTNSRWTELWRKDDWLSVWIGFLILGLFVAGLTVTLAGWKWENTNEVAQIFSWINLRRAVPVLVGFMIVGAVGMALIGKKVGVFLLGFPVVFVLAVVAFVIAGNKTINFYGIEYVFWALAIGLIISNLIGVPRWLKAAANTEFYIKIGLVLLGAEVLFRTILTAGAFGMIQAILVIVVVWSFCYWLAGRLGLDKEFGAILATGVSVCGVSAAIAAGAIAGQKALDLAVIVKMAQNALIGVVAFLLALWSVLRKKESGERPNLGEIWYRFPKFVLGFIAASLFFSLVLDEATAKGITAVTKGLRGYWFALAFVSIGLETKIKELVALEGGRPALAFAGAQVLNIFWTLLIASLIFGGLLFPSLSF